MQVSFFYCAEAVLFFIKAAVGAFTVLYKRRYKVIVIIPCCISLPFDFPCAFGGKIGAVACKIFFQERNFILFYRCTAVSDYAAASAALFIVAAEAFGENLRRNQKIAYFENECPLFHCTLCYLFYPEEFPDELVFPEKVAGVYIIGGPVHYDRYLVAFFKKFSCKILELFFSD